MVFQFAHAFTKGDFLSSPQTENRVLRLGGLSGHFTGWLSNDRVRYQRPAHRLIRVFKYVFKEICEYEGK